MGIYSGDVFAQRKQRAQVARRAVLHRVHLKARCRAAAFSHDDGVLATTHKHLVQLWLAPARRRRELAPFSKLRAFGGATRETTTLRWSRDSKLLAVGSEDFTVRVYTVPHYDERFAESTARHLDSGGDLEDGLNEHDAALVPHKLVPFTLAAHKDTISGAFWCLDGALLSVARDCVAMLWRRGGDDDTLSAAADEPGALLTKAAALRGPKFVLTKKHFLWADANDSERRSVNARVTACDARAPSRVFFPLLDPISTFFFEPSLGERERESIMPKYVCGRRADSFVLLL